MLAVTTGLAMLLAERYPRQPWSPVLVSLLGGLPGLYLLGLAAYLAWEALPATARRPGRRRLAGAWDPADLGVHEVIGGGRMPPYVRRPHDDLSMCLSPVTFSA
jgi:hypothetical protein